MFVGVLVGLLVGVFVGVVVGLFVGAAVITGNAVVGDGVTESTGASVGASLCCASTTDGIHPRRKIIAIEGHKNDRRSSLLEFLLFFFFPRFM